MKDFIARLGIISELFQFLWERKLYWLIPMVVALITLGIVIIVSSNPATQPFIYTLF